MMKPAWSLQFLAQWQWCGISSSPDLRLRGFAIRLPPESVWLCLLMQHMPVEIIYPPPQLVLGVPPQPGIPPH